MTAQPASSPASPQGVSREAFLAAIRHATHRGNAPIAPKAAPDPAPDFARLARSTDPLRDLFIKRATTAGIQLTQTADWPAALRAELAARFPDRKLNITLAITDDTLRAAVREHLADHTILTGDGVSHQFNADIGITDVDAALAETGSIVLTSSPAAPRATALVPPLHIALVFERQILPDLFDLFPASNQSTPPTTLTIISGPSKTADIEGILITGVHGPSELLIILC